MTAIMIKYYFEIINAILRGAGRFFIISSGPRRRRRARLYAIKHPQMFVDNFELDLSLARGTNVRRYFKYLLDETLERRERGEKRGETWKKTLRLDSWNCNCIVDRYWMWHSTLRIDPLNRRAYDTPISLLLLSCDKHTCLRCDSLRFVEKNFPRRKPRDDFRRLPLDGGTRRVLYDTLSQILIYFTGFNNQRHYIWLCSVDSKAI